MINMMRLQLQSAAFFLIGPFVLPALVHCSPSLYYNSPSSSILMILPSDKQTMVLESSWWIGYKYKGDPPRSSWGLLSIASSLLIIITASHQVELIIDNFGGFPKSLPTGWNLIENQGLYSDKGFYLVWNTTQHIKIFSTLNKITVLISTPWAGFFTRWFTRATTTPTAPTWPTPSDTLLFHTLQTYGSGSPRRILYRHRLFWDKSVSHSLHLSFLSPPSLARIRGTPLMELNWRGSKIHL